MKREDVNRKIHEARGLCWHEFDPRTTQEGKLDYDYRTCKHCRKHIRPADQQNIDYQTPEGFFVCWNWARKAEWWDDFMDTLELCWISDKQLRPLRYHMAKLVDQDIFPAQLAEFLEDREKPG